MPPNDAGIDEERDTSKGSHRVAPTRLSHSPLTVLREVQPEYWSCVNRFRVLDGAHALPDDRDCEVQLDQLRSSTYCEVVPMSVNLHLRTIAAAIQTSLISLRNVWGGCDPSKGILDCDSNFLTFQSRKSTFNYWYPLNSLRFEFPMKVKPASSWEVSLSLPDSQIIYVFVVSLLASANVETTIIIHLVRKTRVLTVTGFCLIGVGESYTAVQGKIEKMIRTQMDCTCVEGNGFSSILNMLPAG